MWVRIVIELSVTVSISFRRWHVRSNGYFFFRALETRCDSIKSPLWFSSVSTKSFLNLLRYAYLNEVLNNVKLEKTNRKHPKKAKYYPVKKFFQSLQGTKTCSSVTEVY